MYKEHPVFQKPENENAKIWRYMDFTKFVSLLDSSSLFFTRADKLGDPFEGSYTKENLRLRKIAFKHAPKDMPEEVKKAIVKALKPRRVLFRLITKLTFINSWHENEYESAAMWRLYLKSNEGIAIQSTFSRLKDCFNNGTPDIHIGEVRYIDYEREAISEQNLFYPFLRKRKSFEYEQELRAVVQQWFLLSGTISGKLSTAKGTPEHGMSIPVNLDRLIDTIYIAPTSPEWLFELVKSAAAKYDLNKNILKSTLDAKPLY